MRPHSHRSTLLILTMAFGLAAASACLAATCPSDTILGVSTSSAQGTQSKTVGSPALVGMSASYDLAAGTMSGMYWNAIGDNATTLLMLNDDYVVNGLDAGTPVPLVIYLDVQASTTAGAEYALWLLGPDGDYVYRLGGYVGGDWTDSMDLMKTVTAGVPFRLHINVNGLATAFGYSKVTESAALRFEGLPPGSSITSCQGFHQEAVPVYARTWGNLKAIYR